MNPSHMRLHLGAAPEKCHLRIVSSSLTCGGVIKSFKHKQLRALWETGKSVSMQGSRHVFCEGWTLWTQQPDRRT
jgi:hypothetical protein